MQEGKLSFWHWLSHKLGTNSEFANVHVEAGFVVKSTTCNTCGRSRDTIKLFPYDDEGKNLQTFVSDIKK